MSSEAAPRFLKIDHAPSSGAAVRLQKVESAQAAVCYQRASRLGEAILGPIRLTVDRDFRTRRADGLDVSWFAQGQPFFPQHGIVELKYRIARPFLAKTLVAVLGLVSNRASKNREPIETCGSSNGKEGSDA
jgi:hypothetical protein